MSSSRVLVLGMLMLAGGCAAETWPGGIQARLVWSPEQGARVLDAPEEGAAARAGLQVGDRIVAVDGQPVAPLSAREIHQRLSGEVGTWVRVTVEREGEWVELRIERTPYHSGLR